MAENKTTEQATLDDIESHVPEQLHPILEAAFKHQKQIIVGVVAIIAVAAIYAGMTSYNKKAMASAQAELGAILIKDSGSDKIAKLEALLGNAPSGAKPAVLLELAQASMTNNEFEKAAGYWNQLSGEADADLKVVARLGKAKSLTLAGKPGEAVTILKDLAGTVATAFTIPVNRQLAVAAEAAGDTGTALTAYKKLADSQIPDKPFIDYKVAQLEAK
ncbi:transcriptional regulator [Pseudodesulfovibrio sp. zrk46]|uniref:transcriptional regulator n=1 Tax=Pseudodesulfovibrio sp. zrk46 TaxID=2725288 RepID=UPI001448A9D3|nr:transcriptional regulator [Pseudodesulfovibrio sp. zrk46]QJB57159.1 transcriptional regulator [Pseudodesulfovibrio sp. zrk46]